MVAEPKSIARGDYVVAVLVGLDCGKDFLVASSSFTGLRVPISFFSY